MKATGIRLPGYKLDRHGRVVRDIKRLPINRQLKAKSKRVRPVRRTAPK